MLLMELEQQLTCGKAIYSCDLVQYELTKWQTLYGHYKEKHLPGE